MTNYAIAAVGIVLGVVVTGAACAPKSAAGARLDPALAKYVSPDAVALAEIEAGQLRQTPWFQRNRNQLAAAVPINTGRVLIVWNGRALLIAQKNAASGEVRLSGDPALVSRAQARAKSADGKLPQEFDEALAFLTEADQARVLVRGLPIEGLNLPSEYASLLENFRGHIRLTAIGLEAQSGLNLHARIACFSEQGSQRVDVALRAGIGFARLSAAAKNPADAALYDLLRVRREGTSVFVDGDFPPDLSDYLLRRILLDSRR